MKHARACTTVATIVVFAAAAILLFAGPAGAAVDVAGWDFTDLSTSRIPVTFHLAFDENTIAWTKWDGNQTDVYLADMATKNLTQITATPEGEQSVALDQNRLVWVTPTSQDFSVPGEVRLYDLGTHETRVIGEGRVQPETGLQIVGDHVAWAQVDQASEAPDGLRLGLYVCTISTGSTVRVADQVSVYGGESGGSRSFDLGGAHIAFVKDGLPGQDAEVWLHDLQDSTSLKLGSSAADSRHVSLEGDLVTWAAKAESAQGDSYGSYDVLTHRISTGQTQKIGTREGPESYPKTDGRFVVWDTYDGNLRKIEAYDVQTERLIDVSHNLFLNFTPEISDGLVVWERGGELDSEIMAHDLLSGQTTQLSTNRVYMDQASQVHGRTVVWWMYYPSDTPRDDGFIVASAPESPPEPFQDVGGLHRYRTAILGVHEQGIAGGYLVGGDRLFRPEEPLLRAQFAKMVCEAFDVPVTEDMVPEFTDLGADDPDNLYPHEYVAALSARGILKGVGAGRFDPYTPLTRAQAASILVRALDELYPGLLTEEERQAPGAFYWEPPHLTNLRRAYANDLLAGTVDWLQRWDARVACSRGEAAQLMWNAPALIDQEGR